MALVVESYSSGSSTSGSLTLTAPSGIQEGDLLVLIGNTGSSTTSITSTGFTESFYEEYDGPGGIDDCGVRVLYKIAVLADESAANYTITGQSGLATIAAMLRISGWNTGDPIYSRTASGGYSSTNFTISKSSISQTRLAQQIGIMIFASYEAADSDYYGDMSNITLTSTDANPTFTEVCNIKSVSNNVSGLSSQSFGVAYCTTTSDATVTGWSFDLTEYDPDEGAGAVGVFALIENPVSASGTNALLSASPAEFEPNGGTGGTGTASLHGVSPNLLEPSGKGTAPTQWTNESI